MHRRALLGKCEGKHLHLRELVHAVEPTGGPAVSAGLGAEAVADAAELERQFGRLEDPLVIGAAERDLRGGDQREVGVVDRVDLCLWAAGHEARALEDRVAGEVGRGHHGEALAHEDLNDVPLQREFKEHPVASEEVEAVPRHAGARLEVEEFQAAADLDVIEWLELKRPRRMLSAADLHGSVFAPHRGVWVREVGHGAENRIGLGHDLGRLRLERGDLLAEPAALGLLSLPLGCVGRFADRLAHLGGGGVEPINVGLELPPQFVEGGELRDVGRRAAGPAVGVDEIDVVGDETAVEHGRLRREATALGR